MSGHSGSSTVTLPETSRSMPADTVADLGSPRQLRELNPAELDEACRRIRGFLVEMVCRSGGHLGSNLGAVELTIALHRVFDSPRDVILFDTGHQAYVHKLVTGRAPGFDRLRQRGGLSGYPSRAESAHDVIENSHASTALAYGDGLARAFALGAADRQVVMVVGDGALTGGLCWEAMNNIAGGARAGMVIVLNDNGRSYAPTVGGLAKHLDDLAARRVTAGGNLFECIGLAYLGPVDGHDIGAMEEAFRRASRIGRPAVVHCVTVKGRGYQPAEADNADNLHGVGVVNPLTGRSDRPSTQTWTDVFADEIARIGRDRPDVVCLTAAMSRPVGLSTFADAFPDRVFDVGIAEQEAVTSAAGLALGGLHPVVAVYATFLNRAFDQVLMDVALHRLPVTFVLDRAGITGPDGPSHHGMWDLRLLSAVPGMRIAAPRDATRLRELLREAVAVHTGPTAVRFPKATVGADLPAVERLNGVDVLHRDPRARVLLVGVGPAAALCVAAARRLDQLGVAATVVDPRWVVPVPPGLTCLAARHRLVVTVEDGVRAGGVGGLLVQEAADHGLSTRFRTIGLPRRFIEHGEREELLRLSGVAVDRVVAACLGGHEPDLSRDAEATVDEHNERGRIGGPGRGY